MGISFGLFIVSVVSSIPFILFTKLKVMFEKPGQFDTVAFCVEDLPQFGQVCYVIKLICHIWHQYTKVGASYSLGLAELYHIYIHNEYHRLSIC